MKMRSSGTPLVLVPVWTEWIPQKKIYSLSLKYVQRFHKVRFMRSTNWLIKKDTTFPNTPHVLMFIDHKTKY